MHSCTLIAQAIHIVYYRHSLGTMAHLSKVITQANGSNGLLVHLHFLIIIFGACLQDLAVHTTVHGEISREDLNFKI